MSHCNFFLKRKHRFCKMTVKAGNQFCGEHMDSDVNNDAERVICPLDSKHTCYKKHLASHLKKCNARAVEPPPYIVHGVNSVCANAEGLAAEKKTQTLAEVSDDDLLLLIEKIKTVASAIPSVHKAVMSHPALAEKLRMEEFGPSTRKHLIQNSSLIGHMDKLGLLRDRTCFVEFGAGRGQLSYWLSKALCNTTDCMILLVDYASHRHKFENKLKDEGYPVIRRVRADIADLCISSMDIGNSEHIVGVAKHLCGAAGDMALNCLISSADKEKLTGIVMSFCCHHRCNWPSYTGKNFVLAQGFSAEEFSLLCGVASWATCGLGRKVSAQFPATSGGRYARMELSQKDREEIGQLCKLIFDYGRLQYLKENGFSVNLVSYIERDTSPECLCTLATKTVELSVTQQS
ncbi:tRNA:m(4)X modification enzyme TRM13 homolog [Bacillus rossius redtenbacheri]|uniref:tRNA:m(4)X modification enzyme TRM13 homolog n=1 Tax=Bacillus rossius redtenbacheri TaxID=93214 RepID=UPI002FDD8C00